MRAVDNVSVRVAEPPEMSVTEEVLSDPVGPLATTGDTEVDSDTVPANPPLLFTVIVDEPEDPLFKEREGGLAEIPKSIVM